MIRLLWPVVRRLIGLRRGRMPPAQLPDPLWYFAYGSNMNERLFRDRRHMTPLEFRIGRLPEYRLAFSVAGGMQPGVSAPANIVKAPGSRGIRGPVPAPTTQIRAPKHSEGKQYGYLWTDVIDNAGNHLHAVTYAVPHEAPEGKPGARYLEVIRETARQRGFPAEYRVAQKARPTSGKAHIASGRG